jgi:hypothetical protein
MTALPAEAERLLSTPPEAFVEERKKLAKALREDGRTDEAAAVAALRKPSNVVLAVNRAARDRPQAAKDAADAAERLGRTQLAGGADEYRELVARMDDASALLGEVALAHLARGGKVSDAMRRRALDHVRGTLANDDTRALLRRGALGHELEAPGFDAFAGLPLPKPRRVKPSSTSQSRKRQEEKRELRRAIAQARRELREADERLAAAAEEREQVVRRLEGLEARRRELD